MKKTTRNILIMLAILVVLGGAAALLLLNPAQTEDDASSGTSSLSSASTIELLSVKPTNLASVTVENQEGGFVIEPVEGEDESTVSFTIPQYQDYDLNTTQVASVVSTLSAITASRELGEQEELAPFGLSGEEGAKLTLKYLDGGEDSLVVGNQAGETVGRYVLYKDNVYIVSGLSEMIFNSVFNFFNTQLYTVADRMEETVDSEGSITEAAGEDILYSMKLSGTNFPEPIELEYNENKTSGYLITSPVLAESGTTKFNDMLTGLKTLAATSVADAGLSDEKLEQYGLKDYAARIEFDLNGEEHTITVSEADGNGKRYLLADDKDVVYRIDTATVDGWADAELMDLRMSYIWLPNIMNVSALSINAGGDTVYSYANERTVNEEKSTESSTTYDLTVKNAAGEDIDYTTYQTFYKQLIAMAVLSVKEAEYGDEAVYSVTYSYFSGDESDTIAFYRLEGQDRYAAELNGQYSGLVRKSDLDSLIALLPELDNNTLGKEA